MTHPHIGCLCVAKPIILVGCGFSFQKIYFKSYFTISSVLLKSNNIVHLPITILYHSFIVQTINKYKTYVYKLDTLEL